VIAVTQTPPAGWFDDPEDPASLRYWNGAEWTEHRSPKNAPAAAGQAPPQGSPAQEPPAQTPPARESAPAAASSAEPLDISVRHAPSFAVARIALRPGQVVKAESGAMAAMSGSVEIQAKMEGGFLKALKRSALGGDSFFVTSFRATGPGAWVDVAAHLPGDITVIDVTPTQGIAVTRGAWLANADSVAMDTHWGGSANFAGGEGGFIAHMTGSGSVVVASYGALDLTTLAAGETIIVDSGHLVAYDDTLGLRARTAGGFMTSVKSGEGFIVEVTGPGRVWSQSRNPSALISWLTTVLPFTRA
jgi:uncharacterized protein (TIGR00266 family)